MIIKITLTGFADAVIDVMQKHTPNVQTLNLAANGLETLLPFGRLARALPNLINLSLGDNALTVCSRSACHPEYFSFIFAIIFFVVLFFSSHIL
jgi:hypothetical protein